MNSIFVHIFFMNYMILLLPKGRLCMDEAPVILGGIFASAPPTHA